MFVTDRCIAELYTTPASERLRNVVMVTFPASVEKVKEIVGEAAAAKAEVYNREVSGDTKRERLERAGQWFVELGQQEQKICTLGSCSRSALLYRDGETRLHRSDVYLKLIVNDGAKLILEKVALQPQTDGAAITCNGNATIILNRNNSVSGCESAQSPGIGNGDDAACGKITISGANTVVYTKTGTKNQYNPSSIGWNNYNGSCGKVTIGTEIKRMNRKRSCDRRIK